METAEIPEAAWPRPLPVAEAVFPGSKVWGEVQRLENLIYEVGRVINNKVAQVRDGSFVECTLFRIQQYLNVGKEQHKYVKVLPELQSFRGKLAVEMMKLQQKRQTVQGKPSHDQLITECDFFRCIKRGLLRRHNRRVPRRTCRFTLASTQHNE